MTPVAPQPPDNDIFILSYKTLRKALGWIGIAMPIAVRVVAYAREGITKLDSVSASYYTTSRDLFVGSLVTIGVFLVFYRTQHRLENILTNIAGAAAVGIGLFPMDPKYAPVIVARFADLTNPACYATNGILGFHIYFTAAFFGLLSYITIFLFTKPTHVPVTKQKESRNKIYIGCGVAMLASFLVIAYLKWSSSTASIFWPETTAIAAFSIAWLVKGQTILKDTVPVVAAPAA